MLLFHASLSLPLSPLVFSLLSLTHTHPHTHNKHTHTQLDTMDADDSRVEGGGGGVSLRHCDGGAVDGNMQTRPLYRIPLYIVRVCVCVCVFVCLCVCLFLH